jgi:hypothetical protein
MNQVMNGNGCCLLKMQLSLFYIVITLCIADIILYWIVVGI